MKQYPPIQLVDDNDQPIGGASMDDIHARGLLHRVVHIIVEDASGNILLQKRGPDVATHPGFWDFSAGGHVDEGEDYETAGLRELQEELGISGFPLVKVDVSKNRSTYEHRQLYRFVGLFKVKVPNDIEIRPEASEVAETKWLGNREIAQLVDQGKLTPGLVATLAEYFS